MGEGDEHDVEAGRDGFPRLERGVRIGGGQARVEFSDRGSGLAVARCEDHLELGMTGTQPHELCSGKAGRSDDSYSFHKVREYTTLCIVMQPRRERTRP